MIPEIVVLNCVCYIVEVIVVYIYELLNLRELLIISVAGVDIPAILKNSVIIPMTRYWKHREPPRPRPLQPPYLAALFGSEDPRAAIPPDHCEGPGYTILPAQLQTEALDPLGLALISARVVPGFNQRKSPSRTIFIAVDIWKAFETVSHRLFNL